MKRLYLSPTIKVKEPISAISHLGGVFVGLATMTVLATYAAVRASPVHSIAFAIYGLCMALVFLASTLYHALPLRVSQEKFFRRLDHSMIFMMIAGTYTPIGLVVLHGAVGTAMLVLIWSMAACGIARIWGRPRHVSGQRGRLRRLDAMLYVAMGWVSLGFAFPMAKVLSAPAMGWLFGGGVAYTVGALIYAMKRPNPYPKVFGFHEIFHIFVLLGALCHLWLMTAYVMPLTV